MLIGLAMGTLLGGFYFFFSARGDKEQVKNLAMPAIGIGVFNFISGFFMSFAWPMNAPRAYAYNMLFGDPLLFFGLILIISGSMIYKDRDLGLIPLIVLLLGIYVLVGAYSIVALKLETGEHLVTSMGLYLFDGIGAILVPVLYLKPRTSGIKIFYYAMWIIFLIGTIFALFIGYGAFNGHLASPP